MTDNTLVEIATANEEKYIREILDSSWQGVKRLFVLAYNNAEGDNKVSIDSFRKYFLSSVKTENYNIEIDVTQLKIFKNAVKNKTGTILRISLQMFNTNNLPHGSLLTTRQKTKVRNAYNNNTSTDLKLSKAQISKIIQSGGFLGRLLGPLLKTGLPLIKNVIKPVAKSVLIPLGWTAAASVADAGIHKKVLGPGNTTLLISNEEMNDIMKFIQALEYSDILLKGLTKTIRNETKNKKEDF